MGRVRRTPGTPQRVPEQANASRWAFFSSLTNEEVDRMARTLIKGNEAMSEAAIRAGCRLFFGYPITPQTEILEYMSRRLPQVGGTFLQAESEVAASNMLYGAAGAGARVMTASSSPGISLMMEAVSYMAGAGRSCRR